MWRRNRAAKGEGPPAARVDHAAGAQWLQRLRWTVMRPLAHALGGDERSLVRGPGMELNDVREYQPGDDVRLIDWNITARADRPFVRESQVERALDVWLLLELSASVEWGTTRCLKRDLDLEFAAVASQLLSRHGHRIGALLFADRPLSFVPPANGRNHSMRLLAGIQAAPRQERRGRTDLQAALARAGAMFRHRSLVIVVSDFLVPDGWQHELHRLAQRHEVVAVHLHDPRERQLPDIGIAVLEDPETGNQMVVNTADRALRERFTAAVQAQTARIETDLTSCGVDRLTLGTDVALLPALVRFLSAQRLRRVARPRVAARRAGT